MSAGQGPLERADALVVPGVSEKRRGEVGKFALEDKQALVIQYLATLSKFIIYQKTNVIDLKHALIEKNCDDLNMDIGKNRATYAAGYFPNPLNPSQLTSVAIVPQADYDAKYKHNPAHKLQCRTYISFLLRFTTLILALLSSVYVSPEMATLESVKQLPVDPTQKLPPGEPRNPMPAGIKKALIDGGWFHRYGETELYYFAPPVSGITQSFKMPPNPILWDTLQGILHPLKPVTGAPLLRFNFDEGFQPAQVPSSLPTQGGVQSANPGGAPAFPPGVPGAPMPSQTFVPGRGPSPYGQTQGYGYTPAYGQQPSYGQSMPYGYGQAQASAVQHITIGAGGPGGGVQGPRPSTTNAGVQTNNPSRPSTTSTGTATEVATPTASGKTQNQSVVTSIPAQPIKQETAKQEVPTGSRNTNRRNTPRPSLEIPNKSQQSQQSQQLPGVVRATTVPQTNPPPNSSPKSAVGSAFGIQDGESEVGSFSSGLTAQESLTRRRKTRKGRKVRRATRRYRKQRGGGTVFAFQVTIDSYPSRNPTTFLLSIDGSGWPRQETWAATTPTPTPIDDVIQSWKYDKATDRQGTTTLTMNPLRVEDEKTWERLQEIFNSITTNKEGPSLAAYRAYLLATSKTVEKDTQGVPKNVVTTSICNDNLHRSKTIVHTPGYATVQSLYLDGYEYGTAQRQQEDYATLPAILERNKGVLEPLYSQQTSTYARPKLGDGELSKTVLQNYAFKQVLKPGSVNCNPVSGDKANVLLTAYKELRDKYDRHLNYVYWLLSKLVKITLRTPENELKIQFLPFLMTNPNKQSAVQMMEYVIRAARKTILSHYLEVEQIYNAALIALKA